MNNKPVGLYLHIPFCRSKCPYCDFYSLRADESLKKAYISKLCADIESQSLTFDTVYFGGGTPSSLGPAAIAEILGKVKFTDGAEITVECNPSDTGREGSEFDFGELAASGVNRISMGLQSAVDAERKALGRLSGKTEVQRAVEKAFRAGIENISLDLMSGIPGQTRGTLMESLDFCVNSGAKHISSYILKIEEGTFFHKNRDKLILPDEDETADMYLETAGYLESHRFRQYEISNFSVPGFESRHNLKYWHCEEYLGLGPAAHSFIDGKRFYYPRDIKSYIDGASPIPDGNGGDEEEYIMLALRLREGIKFTDFEEKYGRKLSAEFTEYCRFLEKNGLAVLTGESVNLTPEGFLISNTIITELTERI